MNMRLSTPAAPSREAWLMAGRLAAGAVLLTVAASACTAGGSSVPSTFTPTPLTSSAGSAAQSATHYPVTGRRQLLDDAPGHKHPGDGQVGVGRGLRFQHAAHRTRRRRFRVGVRF